MQSDTNETELQVEPEPNGYTFHPLAAVFPLLAPDGDEMQALTADIAEHGLREPVVMFEGKVLDGRNRITACRLAGVRPKTRTFDGNRLEALALVWSLNRRRRHLNPGQAAIAEEKRTRMHAEYAAEVERMKAEQPKGGRLPKLTKPRERIPEVSEEDRRTDTRRAKAAGTNRRYLADARLLLDSAPDLAEAVEGGKKSLPVAIREVKQRDRHARRLEAAKDAQPDSRIIVGDFREHAGKVPDGSVSLIFTDPPYDRNVTPQLFTDLASFANAKLMDGGSMLCYIGQTKLPLAWSAFSQHLRYWWTICCLHSGGNTMMREYGIQAGWKPILWLVKGTRHDRVRFVRDVVSGGREKQLHDWQQSEAEARYWIDHLCPGDGLVVDPFLGGGTTAAAAKALGRQWLGFEIDPDTARIAAGRLHA